MIIPFTPKAPPAPPRPNEPQGWPVGLRHLAGHLALHGWPFYPIAP